jgi:rsbT co-antagonist protein RsbR
MLEVSTTGIGHPCKRTRTTGFIAIEHIRIKHSKSMPTPTKSRLPEILRKHQQDLLADWMNHLAATLGPSKAIKEEELLEHCAEFQRLLLGVTQNNHISDFEGAEWNGMRELLGNISRSRTRQGYTPKQTAEFVFSYKKPLFVRLRKELPDLDSLAEEMWLANEMLDSLGLYTTDVYLKAREELISRQQQDMLELSTPVVKLWDGVLALPLIGTLDSARTQIVMESLLQRIVETGSTVAIIDITGVPTVDTLVAQHLLKTVTAARLMGADCIISGIRPQIAQTVVHLGVDLGNVITKSSLADAFQMALQRIGLQLSRSRPAQERVS